MSVDSVNVSAESADTLYMDDGNRENEMTKTETTETMIITGRGTGTTFATNRPTDDAKCGGCAAPIRDRTRCWACGTNPTR